MTEGAREPDEDAGDATAHEPARPRALVWSMWLLEHGQDIVTIVVGIVLVLVAGALLVAGVVDFFREAAHRPVITAANDLLENVLLVLILAEIVHTVVLSLQAHRLVPQPFVVVGLVAVIRKILFDMGSSARTPTSELAILLAMVAVFIAGLIAIVRFGEPVRRRP
jgi:uncharacterized membrane protein (DUF373 family)